MLGTEHCRRYAWTAFLFESTVGYNNLVDTMVELNPSSFLSWIYLFIYRFWQLEFVNFAIEFVPLAVEFIALAQKFIITELTA